MATYTPIVYNLMILYYPYKNPNTAKDGRIAVGGN